MALTHTPLNKPSPRNPTIITRWVEAKLKLKELVKRHQAVYPGSSVHVALLTLILVSSVGLEALGKGSIGWYMFCATMAGGYWYDLKDQRNRHRRGVQGVPGQSETVAEGGGSPDIGDGGVAKPPL